MNFICFNPVLPDSLCCPLSIVLDYSFVLGVRMQLVFKFNLNSLTFSVSCMKFGKTLNLPGAQFVSP